MPRYTVILTILAMALITQPAHARLMFGTEDRIHTIQDVPAVGPGGEDLKLAHMTRTEFFLLGLYLKDKGYVLSVEGKPNTYYKLDREWIMQLQDAGALPTPLPEYEISQFEYLMGYSLWIAIAGLIIWVGVQRVREPETPDEPEETAGADQKN